MKTRLLISLLILLFVSVSHAQILQTSEMKPKDGELDAQQIIQQNRDALVSIWYHSDDYYDYYSYSYTSDTNLLNGSGFIIDSTGIIGTNYHVIEGIDSLIIKTSDGVFYDADLIMLDRTNDVAVLKIRETNGRIFQTVKLGNSDAVKVGENVYAIGSPLGYEYTISQGIVAAIRENEKVKLADRTSYGYNEKIFDKVIQITASISPGNSGGALFNAQGEVVGITTYAFMGYGNLNFAVAINKLKDLKETFAANGDMDEVLQRRNEMMFTTNYRLALDFKDLVRNNWYYSKQRDTMKTLDTFVVKKDSMNKVNLAKAEKYYEKCIEIKPDTFVVYKDLVELYAETDNFNKIEDVYQIARERFQSDTLISSLNYFLAQAYSSSKDYDRAISLYNKVLILEPEVTYTYIQLAELYEKKGDYKNALKSYKTLLKKEPANEDANVGVGRIYYEKYNDRAKAEDWFIKMYERNISSGYYSTNFDMLYYLCLLAMEDGRDNEAMLYYIESKNAYSYKEDANEKKLKLYRRFKEYID